MLAVSRIRDQNIINKKFKYRTIELLFCTFSFICDIMKTQGTSRYEKKQKNTIDCLLFCIKRDRKADIKERTGKSNSLRRQKWQKNNGSK